MRRCGMAIEAIEIALLDINQAQCNPPLPDNEVSRIANSICKYPPAPIVEKPSGNGRREAKPDPLPVKCIGNVIAVDVKWLWYPYIPFGKVTLLEGDPGEGEAQW